MYRVTGSRLSEDAGRLDEMVQLDSEQVTGDYLPRHQHQGLGDELEL